MSKGKLIDLVRKRGYIALEKDLSLKEALGNWKKAAGPAKISHTIYVVDGGTLVGVIELRELLLGDEEKNLEAVMNSEFPRVGDKQSISKALSVAVEKEITEVPVVDKDGSMVGVVSVERLVDALNWINTKNIYNLAGILRAREDVELNPLSILRAVKDRLIWLLFAVLAGVFLAGGIIKRFEAAIVTVPAVTFFIPVLMGFGGNIGTQTSTIFVRLLSKKDPSTMRRLLKLFILDLITGAILGIVLGGITAVSASLLFTDPQLGTVLFMSMFVIAIVAVVVGFLIPFASDRFNLDPAIVSAPMVTAIKDILALVIYFSIIGWMLWP